MSQRPQGREILPPSTRDRTPLLISLMACIAGTAAAFHYSGAGLALAHYDARAHLVVARRIIDSLTPGWQQIGAVWLPLPHLLNMLPVQIDALYRTGASAIAISVLSIALATWAMSEAIRRTTGSAAGAIAAAALLLLNPNVLYLQSTPMTEPLLFATVMVSIALTVRWLEDISQSPTAAGTALAAACLTRYEGWPIAAAIVALAVGVLIRRGAPIRTTLGAGARLTAYPAIAIALFLVNSRWTVGSWFVTSGFFVAENVDALAHPLVAWDQLREGLYRLSGTALVWSGYAGTILIVIAYVRSRTRAPLALILAPIAAAALPLSAYVQGHPFRIRYDLPLVAACAALAGGGIGLLWLRIQPIAAALVITAALVQAHPLDPAAPLIVESQRDAVNQKGREAVTAYLVQHRDGRTIMMSMGSLGHYMHDLSAHGFVIRDFLHEGNGDIWNFAITDPKAVVGWIAIEEKAEGGDALFVEARRHPAFLDGFIRVAEGGGVALYRRFY
ncbi:MAG TPA: hypothetical protein VFT39_00830 [Vicinamibacterales bacterium]|nr:hypothetical protein [Vicinamibacterales bacterium]